MYILRVTWGSFWNADTDLVEQRGAWESAFQTSSQTYHRKSIPISLLLLASTPSQQCPWLPFCESVLVLGVGRSLGEGRSSRAPPGRRLCGWGRRASWGLVAPEPAGLCLCWDDSTLPRKVFTFFITLFFLLCWFSWNSKSLPLDDFSLGTNTFCFSKLVDTALCHLIKIKIICVKGIDKLKTGHWNH